MMNDRDRQILRSVVEDRVRAGQLQADQVETAVARAERFYVGDTNALQAVTNAQRELGHSGL